MKLQIGNNVILILVLLKNNLNEGKKIRLQTFAHYQSKPKSNKNVGVSFMRLLNDFCTSTPKALRMVCRMWR